tara:strand:+ start:407 stop:1102 length:696 start_codon:yes stop_codon:yes gene_type:complete
MMFVLASRFIDLSRKSNITEIPINIVEVAEKTEAKKKERKIEKSKKVKQSLQAFNPPKVISKPKPPEFSRNKEKKNTTYKKIKKEEKAEKKNENRLTSILKSIKKVKIEENKKTKEELENKENESIKLQEKLTISEIDLVRRQFISCWNIPAGAKNIKDLKVTIEITLDRQGNVIRSKLLNKGKLNDPFYKAAAESALRAVKHPSCKKLKVPEKKYEIWKNITLNFDPSMF